MRPQAAALNESRDVRVGDGAALRVGLRFTNQEIANLIPIALVIRRDMLLRP